MKDVLRNNEKNQIAMKKSVLTRIKKRVNFVNEATSANNGSASEAA